MRLRTMQDVLGNTEDSGWPSRMPTLRAEENNRDFMLLFVDQLHTRTGAPWHTNIAHNKYEACSAVLLGKLGITSHRNH